MKKVIAGVMVVAVVIVTISATWWYVSSKDVRAYRKRNAELRLVVERQELELKAIQYAHALQKHKAPKVPPKPVVPSDPNS
jgi:hypothetical protein